MLASEHARIALAWLAVSDEEFSEGRRMQASEKLWGAAAHAILAVAIERGWRYGSHRDFVVTVHRLTEESGDETVSECFDEARRFHANFYQNFMEDADIERLRPRVHEFVPTVLDLLDISPDD